MEGAISAAAEVCTCFRQCLRSVIWHGLLPLDRRYRHLLLLTASLFLPNWRWRFGAQDIKTNKNKTKVIAHYWRLGLRLLWYGRLVILLFGIKTGNKKSLVHLPRQLHSSPTTSYRLFIIVRPVVFLALLCPNVLSFICVQCPREQPRKRWFLMKKGGKTKKEFTRRLTGNGRHLILKKYKK